MRKQRVDFVLVQLSIREFRVLSSLDPALCISWSQYEDHQSFSIFVTKRLLKRFWKHVKWNYWRWVFVQQHWIHKEFEEMKRRAKSRKIFQLIFCDLCLLGMERYFADIFLQKMIFPTSDVGNFSLRNQTTFRVPARKDIHSSSMEHRSIKVSLTTFDVVQLVVFLWIFLEQTIIFMLTYQRRKAQRDRR